MIPALEEEQWPLFPGYDSELAVRARGVSRSFGRVSALSGVDLDVRQGSFVVLLGPSGSGKSTLLRSIAGIERIDAGSIELAGTPVDGPKQHVPPERRDLAMVFQDYALWPHLTVEQNVAFALRRNRSDARSKTASALEMLDRVGLAGKAQRYPDELSGGQQQRVALARALVARPQLVLFDEPLSNLDADLRERLRVEIATLTLEAGATAVYITHDQTEAFALADEVVVLDAGRVVQRGTPEEIYHQPATPFVARFTGLSGVLRGRVESISDGIARVRVGAAPVSARAQPGVTVQQEVEVLVRPSAVALAGPATGSGGTTLAGTVLDRAYRGIGYDHVVGTALGPLSGVRHGAARSRGEGCHVVLDPRGCFAFPLASSVD
ncbi:MAG: iron(III) transport system ATP-binding protein [Microbacteriaceae bacterium]|jgi:ABC-type Fe3+/spermidine/putrescine transport system ATPase subunit|nr:iron(III) transport system ATP-binding protein [Microbacteriaceae bacterium]